MLRVLNFQTPERQPIDHDAPPEVHDLPNQVNETLMKIGKISLASSILHIIIRTRKKFGFAIFVSLHFRFVTFSFQFSLTFSFHVDTFKQVSYAYVDDLSADFCMKELFCEVLCAVEHKTVPESENWRYGVNIGICCIHRKGSFDVILALPCLHPSQQPLFIQYKKREEMHVACTNVSYKTLSI